VTLPTLPDSYPRLVVSAPRTGRAYALTPFHPMEDADREHLPQTLLEDIEAFLPPADLIGGYQVTGSSDSIAGYLIEYLAPHRPVPSLVLQVWTGERVISPRHIGAQRLFNAIVHLDCLTP